MTRKTMLLAAGAVVAVLVTAGCSGSSDEVAAESAPTTTVVSSAELDELRAEVAALEGQLTGRIEASELLQDKYSDSESELQSWKRSSERVSQELEIAKRKITSLEMHVERLENPTGTTTTTAAPTLPSERSKGDGFYRVGIDIAPGLWVSNGTGDSCYWQRLDENQDTIDNHFGLAGGSVKIRASDYEVHFRDCGRWEFQG